MLVKLHFKGGRLSCFLFILNFTHKFINDIFSSMAKGIIFDFNGTLFWDSPLHYHAWKEFSKKLRGYEFTDEEMQKYMFGRTNDDIITYAMGAKQPKEISEQLAKEKESYYRDMCRRNPANFVLAPGVIEFLDYLKANDIPRTIATMSEKDNVDFYVKEFNLAKWFDIEKIVYSDGTFLGKPAPDIFLIASEKIGMHPKDCIVFEDALSGIVAARNAGVGEIIAVTSMEDENYYKNIEGVSMIISDFNNVISCVSL